MAVVGAAIAVFPGGAAELRHGDDDGVFSKIAEIGPKCGDRLREVAEYVGDLSLGAAFVDVVVPAADVGKSDLHAEIGFDQLRELLQAVAETALGIVGVGCGRVLRCVGSFQRLDRVESFRAGSMQHGVDGVIVLGFECVRHGRGVGIFSADRKIVQIVDRDRRLFARENARQRRAERDGAEGRVIGWKIMQGAVQPAIVGDLEAGRAGFHIVLRIEMGARGVGRTGGVHDGEMFLFPERFKRRH